MTVTKTKQAWLLLAACIFMLLVNVDYTAVNLALVTISVDLHKDLNIIQWVLSAYVLAWAAVIVPAGKLSDIVGCKRLAMIGLSLFILGSLVAGIANSAGIIIVGRILQGLAGGIFIPTLYSFIHASFPKEKMGFALGFLSLGIGLGMAFGPTFGGVILTYFGWRWIFLINIPLGLIVFAILRYSGQEFIAAPNEVLDKLSAFLLGFFVVIAIYALSQAAFWGLGSVKFLGLMLFAIIMLTCFIWRQFIISEPLVQMSIFTHRSFVGASLTLMIEQFGFTVIVVSVALFLQNSQGYTALASSFIFLALSLMTGLISPLGGRLVPKLGFKKPALFGIFCVAMGSLWLAYLPQTVSVIYILLALAIIGLGMGLALTALQTGIITTVPQNQVGVASGVFIMLALLGNAIGVLFTTLVYQAKTTAILVKQLTELGQTPTELQTTQVQFLVSHVGTIDQGLAAFTLAMQAKIMGWLPYAFGQGFAKVMLINTAAMLFAFLLCALVVKRDA